MILFIASFVCRTLFIYKLGVIYLGVSGLFSNILSMLSLAELGIGNAITFSLYKPLVENNISKIKALMSLYSKVYKMIGCFVAVVGLALIPFLDDLIKDKPDIQGLTVIYILYLANSLASYFLSYKTSIIVADQKSYIKTVYIVLFSLIQYSIQIVVLLVTKNFLLYLIIQVVCTILTDISLFRKANTLYPFLMRKSKDKLDAEDRKDIFKKIRAMMYHNFGYVVANGTDNILISVFIGITYVGIYSNYTMLVKVIRTLTNRIFDSFVASIGNMSYTESKEQTFVVFNTLYFLSFWIYSFCSVMFFVLINPFIKLWIGEAYLLNSLSVALIVLNFYLIGMIQNPRAFKEATGLFWNDRYKPIAEAIINISFSMILLKYYGINGVLLGTLVSTITTSFWVEPYLVYKYLFQQKLSHYFKRFFMLFIFTVAGAGLIAFICFLVNKNSWSSFILMTVIAIVSYNVAVVIFFYRTIEFQNILAKVHQILSYFKRTGVEKND